MRLHPLLAPVGFAGVLVLAASAPVQSQPAGPAGASGGGVAEPSVPDNPQSPTDFPAAVGAAAPGGAGQAGAAEGQGASAEPATGYTGGDLVISDTSPGLYGGTRPARGMRGRVPAVHTVVKGDTLWDLCDQYYGDPWLWPKLWAKNPSITNPHWIYPGNQIKLLPTQEARASTASDVRRPPGAERLVSRLRLGSDNNDRSVVLRRRAFVDGKDLASSGVLVGSAVEHAMLSLQDEVYVKGSDRFKPQVGTVYSIYKVERELKDQGKSLGHIVEVLGTLRVKRLNKQGVATAQIIEANTAIFRGSLVGPLRKSFERVSIKPAGREVDGRIIAHLEPTAMIGQDEVVFVNKGRRDGVERGNRFLVMRRGDGHRVIYQDLEEDDPNYPRETIAEVAVLDTRDHTSIGVVTRTTKELREGDFVRMRRGY